MLTVNFYELEAAARAGNLLAIGGLEEMAAGNGSDKLAARRTLEQVAENPPSEPARRRVQQVLASLATPDE